MSDLTNWNLHGPVRLMREEMTQQDLQTGAWHEPRQRPAITFRPDGKTESIEGRDPDGTAFQTRFTYDASGNLAKTQFRLGDGPPTTTALEYDERGRQTRTILTTPGGTETVVEVFRHSDDGARISTRYLAHTPVPPAAFGIEGSENAYGAEGAESMITRTDQQDRVSEVSFQDRDQAVIRRVLFTRDPEGRLLREVSDSTGASFLKGVENAPPDVRAALTEKIASMFTFITEYRYDAHGRVHQRVRRTGLSEDCETMLYGDYDNLLEQTTEHRSQEVRVEVQDDSRIGTTPVSERSNIQYSRFAYDYDDRGNWIQRTSSYRLDPGSDFRGSGIDRRQIEYFR